MHPSLRVAGRFFFRHQVFLIPLVVVFVAATAEIVLHARPLPRYVTDLVFQQAGDVDAHRPSADVDLLVELNPGARITVPERGRPDRIVTVNALGMRDVERTVVKSADTYRVLALGNSTLYGAAVQDDETITRHMERLLNAREDGTRYEVWNAAVSAYAPHQEAAMGRRFFEMGAAPDAVIFQVSLVGPRAYLSGFVDPLRYLDDPSLIEEHFVLPAWLDARSAAKIGSRSRLALLWLAHFNRRLSKDERFARKALILGPRHKEAMAAFARDFGALAKMAVFTAPCAEKDDFAQIRDLADGAGMSFWCIDADSEDPAFRDGHPPGYVNEYWARRLIERLDELRERP